MTSISSTDFDALDNRSHLGRAYHSGPIVFNSEKKDTREGLSGECLTKSAISFDDSTKQKSLPFDVNLSSFSGHASQDFDDLSSLSDNASQDFDDFDFVGFDYGAGMLPNLKDELDSSREKPLVDFDAPNIKAHGLLVSNSEEKNTREASTRRCMTESICSLVDSMPSISSTDFDALDNRSHLGRAYQSGPIVFNSEQKDTREGLSGQSLSKSAPSFDDKQKLLSDVRILASSLELTSQDLYDIGDFDGFDHCAGRLPNFEDEFNDGLLSSCGDEPIILSTTNCRDQHDAALLPFVNMDTYIHMPSPQSIGKVVQLESSEQKPLEPLGRGCCDSMELEQPGTLEELGMDPENEGIISDFLGFVRKKKSCKKVGKAWTRFYMLYEPPGTHRSSLIAAMANYLKFDIYDLDLTSLSSIRELQDMLFSTTNRSLIAIRDFDHCATKLPILENELTVSLLSVYVDDLMSTCGDERIIIFTTNHRNRHDAALLHPVNVDIYIQNTSPQPLALPDEGETVQNDSSEHKPLVDFDATSIRTYKSGVLVSNSEKKSTGGVSKRRRMTKSVPSFHAPDNGAHLVGVHQSTSSMELDQPENEGIISDLLGFLRDKEFYKRIGKAWKRGYLLYDSPCTDRSSLIAVMANCLEFDIFDLDLTGVSSISELTNVLVSVRNRSVIAIKDFDRWFAMLPNLKNELTISGLMKIIHGFLSSCGDEQIVILTTHHNHVDRVDATLLRPLRFDLYIHKSSPQPKALPDGGEIVLLDSSEQKPYVDFDATNNRACQSNVLVSNSEEKNMREASRRQCMPEGVLSLVDSAIRISSMLTKKKKGISSTNFDAPDNSAQLVRAYQSGPIVFNSEKDDMGDVSNRECFTKSVLTLDDSSVQKSLLDVDITENKSHLVRACQSGSFMSLSDNKNRGEALKITKSILGLEGLQQISRGRRDDAAKSFCGIHPTDSLALISFEVIETLPTWEQPNDCVPLLSLGRLTLEDCVQQEKSPDLPRVMQMNGVEQRVTKLPRYLGVRTPQSASSSHWPIGLPDGGHIVLLDPLDQYTTNIKHAARADQCSPTESRAKKKMVRKTLKRMCRTMSVKFEENHQLFARRCKGDAKSLGAMRIFRKHGINQVSPVKRIHKQHGISQWPFRQKWATRKGYSLGDERPFEVSSLSMDEKLDSRLQFIHRSKSARSSPRALTLPDGGEIVRPVTLSLSEFAATNNRAHLVGQDQSSSTASHYECKNARETSDKQGFEDPERHFGCKDKDVVKSLGVSVSMFKSTCWQHWVYCWPNRFKNNAQQAFDATSNRAHLVKADESSPTVSTSEKGSMREALKRDCLTNALSLEDLRQHFGARHKDAVKGLCYSPTWKSFEVLDSLPLGERSNSTRHLAQQRTLTPEHCVQLKKSQDLLRSPQRDCSGGLAPQSDISLPDGGHILSLSEKKIVRKTLKRKCRSMSVLSLEDHKQHVDKRWEDAAKSHGAKRICRQLVIHRISTAKRIRKQHGIHRWPFQRSAVGLPDGHILPLSEKKIFRTILKRKFRSMNVLRLVDRKQHVDRRWEDAAKNIGAKRICRQLVIHRVSIAKRRQHGIHHRWPFQQDWATMKGYSLGDERPVEVISLSTHAKFVLRLQLIYISWLGRFSLRPSASGGGEVGGPIALLLSESAATKNIAQRVGQDQSGSAASDSENERTREQEDLEEIYTSITSDDLRRLYGRMNRKDAAASLGVSISTFKRKCREYGIKPWPHIRRKKAVLRPPDQHGEKNPPLTCKTMSTNGQTEMENEMFGHLSEMNELVLDFDDGPNEAGVSSEWASQLRNQWTVSTAHPNSSGLVVPHPHMASRILGENMGSLEDWGNSFASLEEPLLPSHDSGSMSTVPPCSYPVPSQPMPTIPRTFLGSSEDQRNLLAFLEDVFPEEHVSGSLLASVEDVSLEEHVHTTGSSDDLRNLLASAEEPFSAGRVFGFIDQIVPSCFDPAPSQSMPNTLHTMPPIPHTMPLLAERQDMRSVMLKATYGDITIRFQLPLTCGVGKLKEEVSKRLECEPGSYHVEYKDEDGTWIIINCDEDVRIFLYLFTSLGNQVIKLRVRDKVPNTTKFCQCGHAADH